MNSKIAKRFFDAEAWQCFTLAALFRLRATWTLKDLWSAVTECAVFHRLPPGSCAHVDKLLNWWLKQEALTLKREAYPENVVLTATPKLTQEWNYCQETARETEQALAQAERRQARREAWESIDRRYLEGTIDSAQFNAELFALDAKYPDLMPKARKRRLARKEKP